MLTEVPYIQKCRSLNNFSTLTSIISALGTAPIARLKRTWDQVPQRVHALLETMRKLMASTKNFGEYREALHAANPPCIPFFGELPNPHPSANAGQVIL
jgi:son of sevenless